MDISHKTYVFILFTTERTLTILIYIGILNKELLLQVKYNYKKKM